MKKIVLLPTKKLNHIEGYGKKRVHWLYQKIKKENIWSKPLFIERKYFLVLDGQHRLEVAKILGIKFVPCLLFNYDDVDVWSLRDNHFVDRNTVIMKSLKGDIYPYKTAKHDFKINLAIYTCNYKLDFLLS